MNLQQIPDKKLLQQTDEIVRKERKCLAALLHHLKEIESRRLYSALGYSSLFNYAVERLKYSEDQACRRISAIRLISELPQLEGKILSGSLTMTTLNMAQNFFRHQKKSKCEYSKAGKLDVLVRLENKSSREAGKELAKIAPVKAWDQVRYVSENEVELRASLSEETLKKLERLKGLLAHSCPDISYGELIDKLADEGLRLRDKSLPAAVRVESKPSTSRYVPAAVRRYVWKRDKSCRICGSDFALQVDHILPVAMGGMSVAENLRLLCRSCNQRAAIEMLGQSKMSQFLV